MAFLPRLSIERGWLPVSGAMVMVCVSAVPTVSDQPPPQQLTVVSVSGEWTQVCQQLQGDCHIPPSAPSPLRFGQTINAGAICLFGTEPGSIVLKQVTPADAPLYPFPCEKADMGGVPTCSRGPRNACAVDVRRIGQASGIRNLLAAMVRITSTQPEKYMVAASRGAEAELADSVVLLKAGRLDLQTIFEEMDPGTYYVELAPIGSTAPSGPPVRVSYGKGQAVRAEVRGVQPGLYRLALVTEKGGLGDSDCWVLVAVEPEYAKQAAAYQQAVNEAKKLPPEMDAAATRALLRAYLESLASPKQGVIRP
jgi:hypothetical protein